MLLFFFNDTATTEIYTLSLHDALPISGVGSQRITKEWLSGKYPHSGSSPGYRWRNAFLPNTVLTPVTPAQIAANPEADRKSTRLNSSHANISYAVFCLKKKQGMISSLP